MKKLVLFLVFFAATGLTLQAQSCSKSAKAVSAKEGAKVCSKATKTTAVKASLEEAILAAEADASVEQKVCEKSGAVCFVKSSTCETSGKVSLHEVQYDAETKKFVNVSPSEMEGDAKATKVNSALKTKKSCDPAACTSKKKAEKTDRT